MGVVIATAFPSPQFFCMEKTDSATTSMGKENICMFRGCKEQAAHRKEVPLTPRLYCTLLLCHEHNSKF
jgi:hypothetical protein